MKDYGFWPFALVFEYFGHILKETACLLLFTPPVL